MHNYLRKSNPRNPFVMDILRETGNTSGLRYIIHKSRLMTSRDERSYLMNKQQEKQKQIEVVIRYLDEFEEIDNEKAREILMLPQKKIYAVSRLFKGMAEKGLIERVRSGKGKVYYSKKRS